jgi:dipeptidase
MKKIACIPMLALLMVSTTLRAQEDFNCFSILVGKKASADGSVLFAHNEDDYGKQLVNWYVEPRKTYHEGTEFILKNGGRTGQPAFTNKYIWLEIPGMDFSDSYLNEFGVCIGSNACSSREDQGEITDGGIGYNLRQIMAERATSARDAVVIAGRLIEQFGYTGSGRTYCIADPNESWALAVVKGKHWVASRIPDDEVMILPNNYTITTVDLNDPENYLGCQDLVDYAIQRGWYNPATEGPFNFRKAYAAKNSIHHPGNTGRAWGAYHLFGCSYNIEDEFPFTFKPSKPVTKQFLMEVLRYHYEGTELDKSDMYTKGSPYKLNGSMICSGASVYGFVTELRSWMPTDIGCLMWLAPQRPDLQPYLPIYAGILDFPDSYRRKGYLNSIEDHYNPLADIHERDSQHAFWAFVTLCELMDKDFAGNINSIKSQNLKLEEKLFENQSVMEPKMIKAFATTPEKVRKQMTNFYGILAKYALKTTRKTIKKIE